MTTTPNKIAYKNRKIRTKIKKAKTKKYKKNRRKSQSNFKILIKKQRIRKTKQLDITQPNT